MIPSLSGSRVRALCFALAAAALLFLGCGPSHEQLFQQSLAREALTCLHPRGEFQSAGEVQSEDADTFVGTIYWRGRALQTNYYTKVRVHQTGDVATIAVLDESSLMPAAEGCQVRLTR